MIPHPGINLPKVRRQASYFIFPRRWRNGPKHPADSNVTLLQPDPGHVHIIDAFKIIPCTHQPDIRIIVPNG